MRKLLMATAAILGASLGMANAAQIYTTQQQQPVGIKNYYGQPTTAASVSPTPASGSTSASPPPGQIAVHIDLRENVYLATTWGTADSINGNKQQPFGIIGYPRLYMSFNGTATNGLQYGMFWEIRETGATGYPSGTASVGASGNDAGSATQSGSYMYWRRDYGYLGFPKYGTVRLGQSDGPYSLMMIGTFDDVATGLFNGDIYTMGVGGGAIGGVVSLWPFDSVGNEYTTAKAIYLSPSIYGFDFGLSWEPASVNLADANACNTYSSTPLDVFGPVNCNTQSTSNATNDWQRRRNTLEAAIRYRGTFGPAGLAASFITVQGSPVRSGPGPFAAPTSGAPTGTFTVSPTTTAITQYKHLSNYDFGAAVTAYGVTVGGNIMWGQYNGQLAPLNAGGTDSLAWIAGAEYVYGPLQIGGSYFKWKYQGYPGLGSARVDQGLGLGLTYNIAPGLALLAEYMYSQRYQGGYNFISGSPGPAFNNVHAQIAGVGFQFRW